MNKAITVLLFVVFGMIAGCQMGTGTTPEEAAKAHVQDRFGDLNVDLTGLTYTVADVKDGAATVAVTGSIVYEEEIHLKKTDDKWESVPAGQTDAAEDADTRHRPSPDSTPHR